MEELTTEKAFQALKQLVLTGVPIQGSFVEIEKKKQAVDKMLNVLEKALDLEQKQDGE